MPSWIFIFRREIADYFYTPIAYIFLIIFLVLNGVLTFYVGGFFDREQADLAAFFTFHPWLYLVLAPALGMRLWAEERKTGTIQTLLTLPVSTVSTVWGKFLASWVFTAVALALTFPMWLSVNYLGQPDNGVIISSYLGSLLMAGSYLAIASCMSTFTQNQVVAFVLGVVVSLLFTLGGFGFIEELLSNFLPYFVVETIISLSFLSHFSTMINGVISLSSVVFFVSIAALFIYISVVAVDLKKND